MKIPCGRCAMGLSCPRADQVDPDPANGDGIAFHHKRDLAEYPAIYLRTAMVAAHTELVNAYNRSPRELGILHTDVSRATRILEEALAKVPA